MNHGAYVTSIKDNSAALSANLKHATTFQIKGFCKQNSQSPSPFHTELSLDGSGECEMF